MNEQQIERRTELAVQVGILYNNYEKLDRDVSNLRTESHSNHEDLVVRLERMENKMLVQKTYITAYVAGISSIIGLIVFIFMEVIPKLGKYW